MIYAKVTEFGTIRLDYKKSSVSDSIKYEKIKFDYPRDWEGLAKTAVFRNGNKTLSVVLDVNNSLCISDDECYIPHEMLTGEEFTVSVFGENSDTRATTKKATITVEKSGYGEGDAPSDPTPTEYQQIISIVNEAKDIASEAKETSTSMREDADNGVFKGEKGDKGDKGDKGEAFTYEDFTAEQLAALKGEKGDTGDTGPQGEKGETGPRGPQGLQGPKGEKGDTGEKGDKGEAFAYEDFTDEQLASIKGEKGDKGEQGDVNENYLKNNYACAIKNSLSGTCLTVYDVSPIEHKLKIYLDNKDSIDYSNINVYIVGKNLFDMRKGKYNGTSSISLSKDDKITVTQAKSQTWVSCNIPVFQGIVGKTVTISGKISTSGANSGALRLMWVSPTGISSGNFLLTKYVTSKEEVEVSVTGVVPEQPSEVYDKLCLMLYSNVDSSIEAGKEYSTTYSDVQIEIGDEQTDYEDYNEQSTVLGEDGTISEINSISPIMTIITDNNEAVINCEYNVDTKKYIDNKITKLLLQ